MASWSHTGQSLKRNKSDLTQNQRNLFQYVSRKWHYETTLLHPVPLMYSKSLSHVHSWLPTLGIQVAFPWHGFVVAHRSITEKGGNECTHSSRGSVFYHESREIIVGLKFREIIVGLKFNFINRKLDLLLHPVSLMYSKSLSHVHS
jgi:hypothetical protein